MGKIREEFIITAGICQWAEPVLSFIGMGKNHILCVLNIFIGD